MNLKPARTKEHIKAIKSLPNLSAFWSSNWIWSFVCQTTASEAYDHWSCDAFSNRFQVDRLPTIPILLFLGYIQWNKFEGYITADKIINLNHWKVIHMVSGLLWSFKSKILYIYSFLLWHYSWGIPQLKEYLILDWNSSHKETKWFPLIHSILSSREIFTRGSLLGKPKALCGRWEKVKTFTP